MLAHTSLLLRLFGQPAAAMSGILDRGSLLFASAAALVRTDSPIILSLRQFLPRASPNLHITFARAARPEFGYRRLWTMAKS